MSREHASRQASAGGRQEPRIGDLRGLRLALRDRGPRRPGPERPRYAGWVVAGACVLLLLAVGVWRESLADWLWPQAGAQRLSIEAGEALARGHLSADDGSGARELYAAALAMDPDRAEPRAGLARVAEAALAQAREALARDRFAEAHARLRLARELSIPRAQADAVATALREREAAHAGIGGLVEQAGAAALAGRLQDEDGALALYARVLDLEPRHPDALRGREDTLSALLEQARANLRAGDVAAAAEAIALARRYDRGHVDLPDTQARFTEEVDALRRRADADLRRGRTEAAVATWQRLLRYDPADAGALDGIGRAAELHARQAQRLAADFRFREAQAALARAAELAPASAEVAAARTALERAQRQHARLRAPVAGREQARRVPGLLEQAAAAQARGDLLTPPGESAYDHLRLAQSIAPGSAEVRSAVARLLPAARDCFERGLSANDLARARRCLDARETLGDGRRDLQAARRRLAERWLAIGDERLGQGQLASARAALASARELDPAAAGLAEFDRRLRTAAGSVD